MKQKLDKNREKTNTLECYLYWNGIKYRIGVQQITMTTKYDRPSEVSLQGIVINE